MIFVPGLFHKVISQSGTSLCPWGSPWDVTPYTKKLANLLSCTTESSLELVSCLRKMDVKDIVATDKQFIVSIMQLAKCFMLIVKNSD